MSSRQSNATVPKHQVQLGLSPSLEGPKAHLGLSWGRKELLPPRKPPPLHVSISIREIKCTPKKTFRATAQVTGRRSRSVSALHKDSSDFLSSLLVSLSGGLWNPPLRTSLPTAFIQPLLGHQLGNVQKSPGWADDGRGCSSQPRRLLLGLLPCLSFLTSP